LIKPSPTRRGGIFGRRAGPLAALLGACLIFDLVAVQPDALWKSANKESKNDL